MNIIRKNDKPIGQLLKEFVVKNEPIKKAFAVIDIEEIYLQKMGPMAANYTKRIYLRGRKLYINITSAPYKAELQFSKQSLMRVLNEEIGDDLIDEIIFM